jgi:hypothetical protein
MHVVYVCRPTINAVQICTDACNEDTKLTLDCAAGGNAQVQQNLFDQFYVAVCYRYAAYLNYIK